MDVYAGDSGVCLCMCAVGSSDALCCVNIRSVYYTDRLKSGEKNYVM